MQVGTRFFVDGGLSSAFVDHKFPAAAAQASSSQAVSTRQLPLVVVTPISGPAIAGRERISPADASFGLGAMTLPGGLMRGQLSVQNLRALLMSVGGGSPAAPEA